MKLFSRNPFRRTKKNNQETVSELSIEKKTDKQITSFVYALCAKLIMEKIMSQGRIDDTAEAEKIFHRNMMNDHYNGIYDMLLILIQKKRYGDGEPEITQVEHVIFIKFIESLQDQDLKGFFDAVQDIESLVPSSQTAGKNKQSKKNRKTKKNKH